MFVRKAILSAGAPIYPLPAFLATPRKAEQNFARSIGQLQMEAETGAHETSQECLAQLSDFYFEA
jgi:hypothetical protein